MTALQRRFAGVSFAALTLGAAAALAAQSPLNVPAVGPMSMGTFAATYLNPALTSLAGCNSGTSAPTNGPGSAPVQFECWVNTSSAPYAVKMYDGASWVTTGYLNPSSHVFTPPSGGGAYGCTFIETFSGAGDNSTNNQPALANLLAALGSTGGCVGFQAGIYKFTSGATFTYPSTNHYSVAFTGMGPGATQLKFPTTDGITINLPLASQSIHFRDMAFVTGTTTKNAIKAVETVYQGTVEQSDITNVLFVGDDLNGSNVHAWGNAAYIQNLSDVNFIGDTIYGSWNSGTPVGNGIYVTSTGSTSSQLAYFYNVTDSIFIYTNAGIVFGNNIQGVTIKGSQFVNCTVGVIANASEANLSLLAITDSQFNCTSNQIATYSAIASINAKGNVFYTTPGNAGIYMAAGGQENIFVGNTFHCLTCSGSTNGSSGIVISGAAATNTISANTFGNMQYGYQLGASVKGTTAAGNSFSTVTTPVVNSGGSACPASASGNCVGTATP